jgi:hypothetical protein
VYEVSHNTSGEQVAFGYAANVAQALSNILQPPSKRGWPFFRRATQGPAHGDDPPVRVAAVEAARLDAAISAKYQQQNVGRLTRSPHWAYASL